MSNRGSAKDLAAPFSLIGYQYSVYTWIVRAVLHLKSIQYRFEDFDPFTEDARENPHPFGRVPMLQHGDVTLFETAPICAYVDAVLDKPTLTPENALERARAMQVVSIVDNYGYWPMIRQVAAQRVFQPLVGQIPDEKVIAQGLEAATPVLTALEEIAKEQVVLNGAELTLADCHLGPMMSYFQRASEGAKALQNYPTLTQWWTRVSQLSFLRDTDPLSNS